MLISTPKTLCLVLKYDTVISIISQLKPYYVSPLTGAPWFTPCNETIIFGAILKSNNWLGLFCNPFVIVNVFVVGDDLYVYIDPANVDLLFYLSKDNLPFPTARFIAAVPLGGPAPRFGVFTSCWPVHMSKKKVQNGSVDCCNWE